MRIKGNRFWLKKVEKFADLRKLFCTWDLEMPLAYIVVIKKTYSETSLPGLNPGSATYKLSDFGRATYT